MIDHNRSNELGKLTHKLPSAICRSVNENYQTTKLHTQGTRFVVKKLTTILLHIEVADKITHLLIPLDR